MNILKFRGMTFALRIKKSALLEFLKIYNLRIEEISGGETKRISREKFINAIRAFSKEFT
jgi:hypothetical protein